MHLACISVLYLTVCVCYTLYLTCIMHVGSNDLVLCVLFIMRVVSYLYMRVESYVYHACCILPAYAVRAFEKGEVESR